MNLVKFLFIGVILSTIMGAFGRYPFSSSTVAIHLTDLLMLINTLFFIIWLVISKTKLKFSKEINWLGVFCLICALSLILSIFSFSLQEIFPGILYFFRFILYSGVSIIAYNIHKSNPGFKDSFLKALVFSGLWLALLGFLQLIFMPNLDYFTGFGFDPHQGRLVSTFLDPNFIGVFLVISLFAAVKKKWWWVIGVLIVAIILTYSRSAYLMLTTYLTLMGLRYKKILLLLVAVFVVVSATLPRFRERIIGAYNLDKSAAERLVTWNNGLDIFKKYPLTGVGFNNLRLVQSKMNYFKSNIVEGGNSGSGLDSGLIFVLATTGVFGLLAYLYYWFLVLRNSDYQTYCLLVALLINGQFINSLFLPMLMVWFLPLLFIKD